MTVKQSLALRIGLDCVLIAICATLFSKNVISLMYHEVVGLVLLILFVVHVVFNRKWVSRVFSGKVKTGRSKVTLVVNALLILSWICVMVTGVLVSKKLFPFQISSLNPLHFFSAALALVMTGIHFGLHWNYFWGWMGKRIRIPKVVAVILCVVILAFGSYRVVTSSFSRWVVAPFTSHEDHGERGERQTAIETDGQREGEITDQASDRESGNAAAQGQHGSHGQQPFSLANLLYTIATWFSILFLFAAITHGVENWMEATQLTGISTGTTNVWSQTVQRHFCFALGCRAIMQVYQGGHMNGFHVICTVLTFVCPAFHEMTGYDRNCPAYHSTPETRQNQSFSVNS